MNLSAAQALRQTAEALHPVAGDEAGQQALLMVAHILGCEAGAVSARRRETLSLLQRALLSDLLARRLKNEPLQYLLGEWGFMGLSFFVRPGALIPRQDTETLVEEALRLVAAKGYKTVLDLCCGTGCIAVSLARLGGAFVCAADIAPECLELTKRNAARNRVAVETVKSDWFTGITGQYDMIVSNPPYLTKADMKALQPELRYEPALALDGGPDGLNAYREIEKEYRSRLRPGGTLLLEVGAGQAEPVKALLGGGYTVRDVAGIERVVCLINEEIA